MLFPRDVETGKGERAKFPRAAVGVELSLVCDRGDSDRPVEPLGVRHVGPQLLRSGFEVPREISPEQPARIVRGQQRMDLDIRGLAAKQSLDFPEQLPGVGVA